MRKPEFTFELTREAAEKNFLVLRRYGFDLEKALSAHQGTPLEYGSEFRTVPELEPLLMLHPLWPHMKSILHEGSLFPLAELDEDTRTADLEEALVRGNHKGAKDKPVLLKKLFGKDVTHGYTVPLPLDKLTRIPGVVIAPVNIQAQNTINEFGQIIAKDRLTHDQSFDFTPGSSVNSRVIQEELLPVRYGHCIKRIINWLVAARRKYPNTKIFGCKVDWKSAYRRVHLAWQTALQTCTQLPEEDIAFLALRLTFGGSPCPAEWCTISELATDLANAILHHPDWVPSELCSPLINSVPARVDLPDEVPFGIGKELVVDVPVNSRGTSDIFVDDILANTVDLPGSDNVERCAGATLLSIHTIARPLLAQEPIPRESMAALDKLLAEAGPEERKIMLGWVLNFRSLIISLPENKATAWSNEISEMLEEGKTQSKRLERNIGRFVNIGMILPYVHHFLARLRTLLKHAKKRRSAIPIPLPVREDLMLMDKIIMRAKNGIDMNNLAYRLPNIVFRNDSCPFGLGGYNVRAAGWRWIIPPDLRFRATNNLLEHLANIVSIKLGLLDGSISKGDCVLSMSDSIVSTSWLRKSNFDEEPDVLEDGTVKMDPLQAEVRAMVAREHALTMMENEICEFAQWFPGIHNEVADALSRDDDRDDETLTNILKSHCTEQVSEHFKIVQLPSEIVAWLTSVLQMLPVREQLREQHTRTKIGRGPDSPSTSRQLEFTTTLTSTTSSGTKKLESLELLHKRCEREGFPAHLMKPWLKQLSEMPSHMWRRPFGTMIGETPPSTRTGSLHDFYLGSSEPTEMQTLLQNNRKQSQHASSKSSPIPTKQNSNEQ